MKIYTRGTQVITLDDWGNLNKTQKIGRMREVSFSELCDNLSNPFAVSMLLENVKFMLLNLPESEHVALMKHIILAFKQEIIKINGQEHSGRDSGKVLARFISYFGLEKVLLFTDNPGERFSFIARKLDIKALYKQINNDPQRFNLFLELFKSDGNVYVRRFLRFASILWCGTAFHKNMFLIAMRALDLKQPKSMEFYKLTLLTLIHDINNRHIEKTTALTRILNMQIKRRFKSVSLIDYILSKVQALHVNSHSIADKILVAILAIETCSRGIYANGGKMSPQLKELLFTQLTSLLSQMSRNGRGEKFAKVLETVSELEKSEHSLKSELDDAVFSVPTRLALSVGKKMSVHDSRHLPGYEGLMDEDERRESVESFCSSKVDGLDDSGVQNEQDALRAKPERETLCRFSEMRFSEFGDQLVASEADFFVDIREAADSYSYATGQSIFSEACEKVKKYTLEWKKNNEERGYVSFYPANLLENFGLAIASTAKRTDDSSPEILNALLKLIKLLPIEQQQQRQLQNRIVDGITSSAHHLFLEKYHYLSFSGENVTHFLFSKLLTWELESIKEYYQRMVPRLPADDSELKASLSIEFDSLELTQSRMLVVRTIFLRIIGDLMVRITPEGFIIRMHDFLINAQFSHEEMLGIYFEQLFQSEISPEVFQYYCTRLVQYAENKKFLNISKETVFDIYFEQLLNAPLFQIHFVSMNEQAGDIYHEKRKKFFELLRNSSKIDVFREQFLSGKLESGQTEKQVIYFFYDTLSETPEHQTLFILNCIKKGGVFSIPDEISLSHLIVDIWNHLSEHADMQQKFLVDCMKKWGLLAIPDGVCIDAQLQCIKEIQINTPELLEEWIPLNNIEAFKEIIVHFAKTDKRENFQIELLDVLKQQWDHDEDAEQELCVIALKSLDLKIDIQKDYFYDVMRRVFDDLQDMLETTTPEFEYNWNGGRLGEDGMGEWVDSSSCHVKSTSDSEYLKFMVFCHEKLTLSVQDIYQNILPPQGGINTLFFHLLISEAKSDKYRRAIFLDILKVLMDEHGLLSKSTIEVTKDSFKRIFRWFAPRENELQLARALLTWKEEKHQKVALLCIVNAMYSPVNQQKIFPEILSVLLNKHSWLTLDSFEEKQKVFTEIFQALVSEENELQLAVTLLSWDNQTFQKKVLLLIPEAMCSSKNKAIFLMKYDQYLCEILSEDTDFSPLKRNPSETSSRATTGESVASSDSPVASDSKTYKIREVLFGTQQRHTLYSCMTTYRNGEKAMHIKTADTQELNRPRSFSCG
jgi:hypothetical protein